MSFVSQAVEGVGALMAWFYPHQQRSGREKVSLTDNHTIPDEWRSVIGARAKFFLVLFTLCFVMAAGVSKATELVFGDNTAFCVLAEHFVMAVYWYALRNSLQRWAKWWDFVESGVIQESWLSVGYFPWETSGSSKPKKRKPAKLLEDLYKSFVFGEYITIEHLTSGTLMFYGLVTGNPMWWRHGVVCNAGGCTSELVDDYWRLFKATVFPAPSKTWGTAEQQELAHKYFEGTWNFVKKSGGHPHGGWVAPSPQLTIKDRSGWEHMKGYGDCLRGNFQFEWTSIAGNECTGKVLTPWWREDRVIKMTLGDNGELTLVILNTDCEDCTTTWKRAETQPTASGNLTAVMKKLWALTGGFVRSKMLSNCHHGPIWLSFIPLCLYCSSTFAVQLSCTVLAFNPEHLFGHMLYWIRYTPLKIQDGEWQYAPERRGAVELSVLWCAFKAIFIILWRICLYQVPLAYWLGNEIYNCNFSWLLLLLTIGYSGMTWFNIQFIVPVPFCPKTGQWTWRSMKDRFSAIRGATSTADRLLGGLNALHIKELPLREHLAEAVQEEVARAKEAGWDRDWSPVPEQDEEEVRLPALLRCRSA